MASYGGGFAGGLTSGAGLGTRIGVAFVSLTTDNSGLRRGFGEAQAEAAAWARKYGTTVGSGLAQSSRQLQAVGTTITRRLSLPLALAAGAATSYAAKFDQAMQRTVALSGIAANRLQYFTDQVRALSKETGEDAVGLADTLYFVASAGLKTSQILPVLTLAAKGATAGLGSAEEIGQTLTSVLNAYADTNITAAKATDVLVEAIRQGKAEPSDFAATLGSVIPVGAQLGISFDQLAAAVATATNYGVDAARAVTGLRYALVNMEKPTDKSKEVLAQYGLSIGEVQKMLADPNVGLLKTFEFLADTFDITTVKGREAWQTVIGGTRGTILANTLVGQNFKRNQQIFADVGIAAKKGGDQIGAAYDIMRQTPARQFTIAWNQIKLAAIDAGGAILPIAEKIITMIGDAAGAFSKMPAGVQQSIVGVGLFLVALGPVATGLGLVGRAIAVIAARSAGLFNTLAGNTLKPVSATEALIGANTELTGSTSLLTAAIDRLALALGTTLPAAAEVGTESLAGMSASEAAAAASGFGYYQAGVGPQARWRNASGTIVSNAEAEAARAEMIAAREAAAAEGDLAAAETEQAAAAVRAAGASEDLAGVLGITVPGAALRGTEGLEGFTAAQSGLLVPEGEASVLGLADAMGIALPAAASRGGAAVGDFVATESGLLVPGAQASVDALAASLGIGIPAAAERATLGLGEFTVAQSGLIVPATLVDMGELEAGLGVALPAAIGRATGDLGVFEATESGLLLPTEGLTAAVDELAASIGIGLPAAVVRGEAALAGFEAAESGLLVPTGAAAGGAAAGAAGAGAGIGAAETAGAGAVAGAGGAAAIDIALPPALEGAVAGGAGGAIDILLPGEVAGGITAAGVGAIYAAIAAGVYVVSRAYNRLSFDAADAAGAAGLTVNQVKALEDQYNRSAVQLNPFGSTGDKIQEAGDIYRTVLEEAVKAGIPLEVAQRKLNAGWAEAVDQIGGLTGSMPAFRQQLESTLGLAESPEADAFRQLIADMNPINPPPTPFGGQTLGPGGFPVAQGPTGKPVLPQDQFALSPEFIQGLLPTVPPPSRTGAAPWAAANSALATERTNLLAVTDQVNASIQAHEDMTQIVKTLGFAVSKGVITWDAYYAILKQIGADVPLAKLGEWGRLIRETAGGTDKQRAALAGLVTQMQAQGVHVAPLTERLVRSALATGDWALAIARLTEGLKTAGHDALLQHADDLTKAQIAAIKAKFATGEYAAGIKLLDRDLKQVERKHEIKVETKDGNARERITHLSAQLGKVEGEHDLRVKLVDQAALRGLRNLKRITDDILAARRVDVDIRANNAPTGQLPVMSPQVAAQYAALEGRLDRARQNAHDFGVEVEKPHKVDVDVSRAQADLEAFVRAWSNGRIVIGVDVQPGGPPGPTTGGHHHHGPVHPANPHQQLRVGGVVRRMHEGGSLWGDEVPIIAHTEEFITRAPIARRNENYLRYLNQHGRPMDMGGSRANDDALIRLAASHQAQIDDVSGAVRELAHAIAKGGVHMDGHKVGTLLKREDRRRMGM